MGNNDINKRRVSLGIMILLVSYFILTIILKLCGIDLFTVTNNANWLTTISNAISSNPYSLVLLQTIIFVINMFFVYSITANRYDTKRMVLVTLMTLPPLYGINLLFYFYNMPTVIFTVVIPFIISIFLVKNRTIKGYLFAVLRYILFSAFIILAEMGLMYLKINLLHFDYHLDNIFNVILLNLDLFAFYFSIYFCCKYVKIKKKNKEE